MGQRLNTQYSMSFLKNSNQIKCANCSICRTLVDLQEDVQGRVRSCEGCDAITCSSCYERMDESKQSECPVCRQDTVVDMSHFQKKTYSNIPLSCICGESFILKDIPRHSYTCPHLKCPICADGLSVACRPHIAEMKELNDHLKEEVSGLRIEVDNMRDYIQRLEVYQSHLKDFLRQNGWEASDME